MGERPYADMSNQEVAAQVKLGYRMPCPAQCPSAIFATLVMPCWAAEPADRPGCEAIATQLAAQQQSLARLQQSSRLQSPASSVRPSVQWGNSAHARARQY